MKNILKLWFSNKTVLKPDLWESIEKYKDESISFFWNNGDVFKVVDKYTPKGYESSIDRRVFSSGPFKLINHNVEYKVYADPQKLNEKLHEFGDDIPKYFRIIEEYEMGDGVLLKDKRVARFVSAALEFIGKLDYVQLEFQNPEDSADFWREMHPTCNIASKITEDEYYDAVHSNIEMYTQDKASLEYRW